METAYHDPAAPEMPQNGNGEGEKSSITLEQLGEQAREVLGAMLPLLSFEAKLTTNIETQAVRIRMECDDAGRLIGRRGTTVNEIQFLLNRILQRRHKSIPRIFLDVDGPKEEEKVQGEISERIKGLADQVRRWGDPMDTEPLSSTERKQVEEYFSKDKELQVISLSSGGGAEGPSRLRIQLKN